jgi:dolichol kinase
MLLEEFVAALLEAVTPYGMDNLSVPIGTTIVLHLLSKSLIAQL